MSTTIKVAIIGTGPTAENHIVRQKRHSIFSPVNIFGKDVKRRRFLAEKHDLKEASTLDECLNDKAIDAVDISTVNNRHFAYALRALQSEKMVIVEKPAAFSLKEVDCLSQESLKRKIPVIVVLQKRYNWTFSKVLEGVEAGKFGKFIYGTSTSFLPRPNSYYSSKYKNNKKLSGGGALIYQGIHDFDLILQLVGSVSHINGRLQNGYHQMEVEDTAYVELNCLEGGKQVFCSSTNPNLPGRVTNELYFERANVRYSDFDLTIHMNERSADSEFTLGYLHRKRLQILRKFRGDYSNILQESADIFHGRIEHSRCSIETTRNTHRLIEDMYSIDKI